MKYSLSHTIHLLLIVAVLGWSCSKQEFAANKQKQDEIIPARTQFVNTACSKSTTIKPAVDFLFIWDNSTSTNFISNSTKQALNGLIEKISEEFDYHILMAPLIGSGNSNVAFVSSTTTGLSTQALSYRVPKEQADDVLSLFPTQPGNTEAGLNRATELLTLNSSNTIFRSQAYTFVVILSNEDDNSWVDPSDAYASGAKQVAFIEKKKNELLCIRGNHNVSSSSCTGLPNLNSAQLRLFSVGAYNNTCNGAKPNFKSNYTYRQVSKQLYAASYTDGRDLPNDQSGRAQPDSYDVCSMDFLHIFDGINDSINAILVKHQYNYWPVSKQGDPDFDPDTLDVSKNGIPLTRLQEPVGSGSSGYSFQNVLYIEQNTRFDPTPGEPFTGKMIKLYGNAIVTYPECILVTKLEPKAYFGFYAITSKPFEASIQVKINGQSIPQSSTNGWQLVKSGGVPVYINSKNTAIISPSNRSPFVPVNPNYVKSGYFIELFGSAVYSHESQVEVLYDPQS